MHVFFSFETVMDVQIPKSTNAAVEQNTSVFQQISHVDDRLEIDSCTCTDEFFDAVIGFYPSVLQHEGSLMDYECGYVKVAPDE